MLQTGRAGFLCRGTYDLDFFLRLFFSFFFFFPMIVLFSFRYLFHYLSTIFCSLISVFKYLLVILLAFVYVVLQCGPVSLISRTILAGFPPPEGSWSMDGPCRSISQAFSTFPRRSWPDGLAPLHTRGRFVAAARPKGRALAGIIPDSSASRPHCERHLPNQSSVMARALPTPPAVTWSSHPPVRASAISAAALAGPPGRDSMLRPLAPRVGICLQLLF